MLGVLAMIVALGCWALASPIGSSPDEDFHLGSIWCSHGFETGVCEPGPTADTRLLPEQLVNATCYKQLAYVSADCQTGPLPDAGMAETHRGNWFDHSYPPVFYWFEGVFVGADLTNSVLLMRAINILLFVSLVVAIYVLVPTGLRRSMVGGALITAVPLGLFLVASINPSGWAILSAVTLLVALLGCLRATDRRRRYGLGALAALSLLLGAGARADAASYAVVAIGVAIILTVRLRFDVRSLTKLVFPVVLAICAIVAFFSAGQSAALSGSGSPTQEPLTLGTLVDTALDVPTLWSGALGVSWGLGWLDTGLPGIVGVFSLSVFAGVMVVAVVGLGMRWRLGLALVGLAAVVVPTYILITSGVKVPVGVQPRYILPLLALFAVTAMVRLHGTAFRLTGGQRWIVVALLTMANAVALHTNIKRYTVGLDGLAFNLDRDIEWWWQIPISPMAVWLLGSLVFGVATILLTREFIVVAPATGEAEAAEPGALVTGGADEERAGQQPPAPALVVAPLIQSVG